MLRGYAVYVADRDRCITGVPGPRDRKTTGDPAQERDPAKRFDPILRN